MAALQNTLLIAFLSALIATIIGTAASIAISSGANVKAVQRMLGHKNAAMTLDTYADLFDTDLDDVATSISSKIAAAKTSNWCWRRRQS